MYFTDGSSLVELFCQHQRNDPAFGDLMQLVGIRCVTTVPKRQICLPGAPIPNISTFGSFDATASLHSEYYNPSWSHAAIDLYRGHHIEKVRTHLGSLNERQRENQEGQLWLRTTQQNPY